MTLIPTPQDRRQRRMGTLVFGGLGVLLFVLATKLIHIQIVDRAKLLDIADQQQNARAEIPARRGMIFDSRGRAAALTRRIPDVFVDPVMVEDAADLAAKLGPRLNQSPSEILAKLHDRPLSRFVVVASGVDDVTADAVRSLGHVAVGLSYRSERFYPLGSSMAHVLGWVGYDGTGLEGIELSYDDHLRGRDGRRRTIRDARRRALRRSEEPDIPPVDGGHLVLTIDAEIQRMVEESLKRGVVQVEAESGVAVVMTPDTGDVLAMACFPTFDPNKPFLAGEAGVRRNRAVTDPVEPGSSFKPVIAAAALDGGFASRREQIDCHNGQHYFGKRLITDTRPRGMLDLRGIICHSSNIGMCTIAVRMGNEVLHDTVTAFGFGRPTGIELPGEGAGIVMPLKRWTSYSTTSIPIGYEILVTPLQLLSAFTALINDGVLIRPRVVRTRLGPDGGVIETFEGPNVVRRVASTEAARFLTYDAMRAVVEEGGAAKAQIGPYKVLGKTGTAKLTYPDRRGYEEGAYLSVFVGAAPADDPRIVVLTIVRRANPAIAYYGGQVAAPVVGEIIARVLAYLQVPGEDGSVATGL
jgi:cell division protein FtsI/penicillin-binding protein 2